MHHVLIPIEAGHAERTASAVAQAVKLHQAEPAQVHLLRVRPPVSGHVAMLFPSAELHELQVDWGLEELAPAKRLFGTPAEQVRHLLNTQGDPVVLGS